MKNSIEKNFKKLIVKCGDNNDIEDINYKTHLKDDLGYSSINMMQLIYEVENEFNITLEELDLEEMLNYQDLLHLINLKLKLLT